MRLVPRVSAPGERRTAYATSAAKTTASSAARPDTRRLFQARSAKRAIAGSSVSARAWRASSTSGSTKPNTIGSTQMTVAVQARTPVRRCRADGAGERLRLLPATRAAPRDQCSSRIAPITKASSAAESCAAATRSPSENQAR